MKVKKVEMNGTKAIYICYALEHQMWRD